MLRFTHLRERWGHVAFGMTIVLVLAGGLAVSLPTAGARQDTASAQARAAAPALTCSPTGAGDIALAGGARVDVLDSLAQLLPSTPQAGAGTASICQARNAYESFQIEVTAGAAAEQVKSVTASALTASGGASIPASDLTLYREDYTTLQTMTDSELSGVVPRDPNTGQCTAADCRFPDALIPDVDPLFHEKRDAFPFSVPARQDRVVWTDVFVPAGQPAGLYTGTLTITPGTGAATSVHVSLRVVNATLPSTSTTHSAYFLDQGNRGLTGGSITPAQYDLFAELGLDDRINITPSSPLAGLTTAAQLSPYLKPLLTGTDPRVALKDAQLTDFPLHTPWTSSDVAPYKALFTQLGVGARASIYCDEGTPQNCADLVANSGARSDWPALHVLATRGIPQQNWPDPKSGGVSSVVPATTGSVNLATLATTVIPILQTVDSITGYAYPTAGSRMPVYGQWRGSTASTGRVVWTYGSCESGGCGDGYPSDTPGDNPNLFVGWPSLGIDQVATEQRAMGWQMYRFGINGEEYYSVDSDSDIWTSPFLSGMNGDGTLFYPWDAARIGGADPIPIESIRLKRIRDGREDYELLRQLAVKSSTDSAAAGKLASTTFTTMDTSNISDSTFDSDRQQLLDDLAAVPQAPSGVVARTGNASASVTWAGSPDTEAPPITGYRVTAAPSGKTCTTSGQVTCVVTGLTNGTSYTFTVVALSSSGASPASPPSGPVVPVVSDSIDDLNCDGTADFLAVQNSSGNLLFYPRIKSGATDDWSPSAPIVEGSGYGGSTATLTYPSLFFAGDLNGNGAPDVVGVTSSGHVMLLPGDCTGHLGTAVATGATVTNAIGVGDFNSDGHPDLLDRHSDGTLWMLPGTGAGTFGAAHEVSGGWSAFSTLVAAGDFNADGHPDLVARRSDGSLVLFEGTGAGAFKQPVTAGIALAPTLTPGGYPVLVGAGDFDGDAHVDLAAANSAGQLLNYRGNGSNLAGAGQVIGNGWTGSVLVEIAR